jgi:predicted histidine transporter YuiF (NhaC family)
LIVDADFLPKLLINILTSILMSAICIGLIGQFSFHTSMPIAHSPLYKNNQIVFSC